MRKFFIVIALLLPVPPAWAEGCRTPQNFAALVELIARVGQTSDYGLTLASDEKPYRYYASLVRGDLPELHLTRERWSRQLRGRNRVDQWVMKFTFDGTYILHKQIAEKDHRLVHEKRLSNKGSDMVECNIFSVLLGTLKD
jgi:hypothetical protein